MPRASALFADTKTTEQTVEYRFFRIHPNQLTQAFDGHHRLSDSHSRSEAPSSASAAVAVQRATAEKRSCCLREHNGHLALSRARPVACG